MESSVSYFAFNSLLFHLLLIIIIVFLIFLLIIIKSNTSEELEQSLSSSQYDAQAFEEWTILSEEDTNDEQELQQVLNICKLFNLINIF
jgi:large-conductance mechanosensitive channel